MPRGRTASAKIVPIGGQVPTNGADDAIAMTEPYIATIRIKGTVPYLYHAWNVEAVEEKAAAPKGSEIKKTDNVESYVYRDDDGFLAISGEQFRASIINAAKYMQDPRSSRKSAQDLFKAGISDLTIMARVGPKPTKEWHHLDRRRVQVRGSAVTRSRPSLQAGYEAEFELLVDLPEYITDAILLDIATKAGRLCGIGNYRPTYGRFAVVSFQIRKDE